MKKLFYILFVFFILTFNSYSQPLQPNGLPDVMNNITISQFDFNGFKSLMLNLDSFPVYPNFPKHISGKTFEGCIFCNMDNDPESEIVINIGYTVQAFNIDGSNVSGWPKTVSSYVLEGAPAFGDIDGDGYDEIVVTNHGLTSGGYIYAFKRDGTPVSGFPINHGYSASTPVLADVNNDGKMEIIVNKRTYPTGLVYIYKYDGTILTGWPKNIGHVPASSAAVGDIDGDNTPEIIMESYTGLYAWKVNGDSIPGFPFMMPNNAVNSYSSPVLADVNGDGNREIIFGTHVSGGNGGYLFVLKRDGLVQTGWPKFTDSWIYGPPAVGYIDSDNYLDIAIGDQTLSSSPTNYVYAWDRNGQLLTGFPVGPFNAINCQIILADIDGDNLTELIFDDNTYNTAGFGKYLAYNHNATPVSGWPLITTGTTFFTTPCYTDMNRDGILDMIGTGIQDVSPYQYTNVYLWNTGQPYHYSKNYIPMWQYNPRHNGVYGDIPPIVGIPEINKNIPNKFELMQNYPNPFNPKTVIGYSLLENSNVSIKVFDLIGREIATLVNEYKKAGNYNVSFDAARHGGLSSGIYFYRINAGDFSETKMMMLIK